MDTRRGISLTLAVVAGGGMALFGLMPALTRDHKEVDAAGHANHLAHLAHLTHGEAAAPVRAREVRLSVREWAFTTRLGLVEKALPAIEPGRVTFLVRNTGRRVHLISLLRTGRAANALPLHHGVPVMTGLVRRVRVAPGGVARVTASLRDGAYVLTCSLRGHYQHGMFASVRVRQAGPVAGAPVAAAPAATLSTSLDLGTSGVMAFTRRSLSAPEGKITLSLLNTSPLPHAIALRGPGVDVKGSEAGQGGRSTVVATLGPGTYTFYCPVPGHEAAGMRGTLIVTRRDQPAPPQAADAAPVGTDPAAAATAPSATIVGVPAAAGGPTVLKLGTGGPMAFNATAMQAQAGEVTIEFTNSSTVDHGIGLQGPGVDLQGAVVGQGAISTVTGSLAPGTYTFYCIVGSHAQAGMSGTLTVVSAVSGPVAPGTATPAAPPGIQVRVLATGAFDQAHVTAPHGSVTIVMTNDSRFPRSIGIRDHGVEATGPVVGPGGTSTVTAILEPHTYRIVSAGPGIEEEARAVLAVT